MLALLPAEILTMLLHFRSVANLWRGYEALKQFPATDKEYSLLSNHCLQYTVPCGDCKLSRSHSPKSELYWLHQSNSCYPVRFQRSGLPDKKSGCSSTQKSSSSMTLEASGVFCLLGISIFFFIN